MTQIGAVGDNECLESDKSTQQSLDREHSSTSSAGVIFDDD